MPRVKGYRAWVFGLLLGGIAADIAMAQGAGIYVCIDARGRKLTSDRPIPECIDREQRELSPSGSVRRTIGPTLTAQELAAQEARNRQAQEGANKVLEEKRRDKALLARYPNKDSHDRVRAESLVQVDEAIRSANAQLAQHFKQRKDLDAEMEFYKSNPAKVPATLKRQYETVDASIATQQTYIKDQQEEKNRVNARFDSELAKLNQLWSGVPSAIR